MAQTGFTPIQIYYSTTTSNVPSAGNLTDGELAINTADGKLFYKDNLGVVRVIAQTSSVTNVSSISFGSTGLTPSTATTGAITVAGTLVAGNGGTGQSTYTTGDLLYATGSTALSKLGIGTNGQILTSTGTAPQWSTLSGVAVTTFSAGTTGFTPSVATSGAITLAGTLATTNGGTGLTTFGAANRAIYSTSSSALTAGTLPTAAGGTGLTSFTANGVVYASSSSALTTGSALTFDGAGAFRVTESSGTAALQLLTSGSGGQLAYIQPTRSGPLDISSEASNPSIAFRLGTSAPTTEQMRLTSTGLGIGTSSPGAKLQLNGDSGAILQAASASVQIPITFKASYGDSASAIVGGDFTNNFSGYLAFQTRVQFGALTERMRIDSAGNLGIGTSSPAYKLDVVGATARITNAGGAGLITQNSTASVNWEFGVDGGGTGYVYTGQSSALAFSTNATERARITAGGQFAVSSAGTAGAPVISKSDDLDTGIFFPAANEIALAVGGVEELRITSAGFTRPVAYADTVSALGNTGTATTIDLRNANVFTATLTGNCTFTLSNPIATGSSSFTLILTNDGTAGRTVAWAGGSFVFPGGAASLSRTTTANAVDVWVFFTPNGGTTWYGNIAMKDMKA